MRFLGWLFGKNGVDKDLSQEIQESISKNKPAKRKRQKSDSLIKLKVASELLRFEDITDEYLIEATKRLRERKSG